MITKLQKWSVGLLGVAIVSTSHAQSEVYFPSGVFGETDAVSQLGVGTLTSTGAAIDLGLIGNLAIQTDLLDNTPAVGAADFNGVATWTHSAKGLVHAELTLLFATLLRVDLYSQVHTNGSSLVFSRHLDAVLLGGSLGDVLSHVLGASVINAWSSTAHINLQNTLTAGHYYSIKFDVNVLSGLPVSLLSHASFSVSSNNQQIYKAGGGELLNLVDVLKISDEALGNGTAEFTFLALEDLTSLDLTWSLATVADVSLLGSPGENQTIMAFDNLRVTPVPEPSSALLFLVGGAMILRRSRRGLI